MGRLLAVALLAALAISLASCGGRKATMVTIYHAVDYQEHRQTAWIKVHWDITHPDDKTVVAEGFVEPFSPKFGVFDVQLNLVGLDADGNVVNTAEGRPADNLVATPINYSPFTISMKLNGKESDFTITGSYYYYIVGTRPVFEQRFMDRIPLHSDEPY